MATPADHNNDLNVIYLRMSRGQVTTALNFTAYRPGRVEIALMEDDEDNITFAVRRTAVVTRDGSEPTFGGTQSHQQAQYVSQPLETQESQESQPTASTLPSVVQGQA
ncbi:hypothetical protein CONPUDRAFT_155097 [Coniophora puteana RWD-64-598 SS2]|uniref:Uncharacterized protein n=1 Tax=Coniophora puteana (strain RWD-64-598) TaxID=741705 RepID=A0A5M3MKF5_CONPW|nr:uncharacterized protein CONPUDRAFT_155097 [Coniophora puteana RWD-64-598 SS2]EIW79702.1 hypothetical protein CONPUDRAFT_155097 [Coniophora puteana RWD-64-598 SS2]